MGKAFNHSYFLRVSGSPRSSSSVSLLSRPCEGLEGEREKKEKKEPRLHHLHSIRIIIPRNAQQSLREVRGNKTQRQPPPSSPY